MDGWTYTMTGRNRVLQKSTNDDPRPNRGVNLIHRGNSAQNPSRINQGDAERQQSDEVEHEVRVV